MQHSLILIITQEKKVHIITEERMYLESLILSYKCGTPQKRLDFCINLELTFYNSFTKKFSRGDPYSMYVAAVRIVFVTFEKVAKMHFGGIFALQI